MNPTVSSGAGPNHSLKGWQFSLGGHYKVNTDGTHNNPAHGSPACGGLIRDGRGTFIKGLYVKLSFSTAHYAEFSSLVYGIILASNFSLRHVTFELIQAL